VGLSQVRMVIVGGGEPTARIVRKVQSVPELGYVIAGIVCDQRQAGHTCEVPDGSVLLGHIDDLADIVRANEIDELIITMSGVTQAELFDLVGMCDDLPVNIRIYPEAFQLVTANEVTISALTGLPLVSVKDVALRGVNRFIKRGMDIAISLALLVIVSPVMLLIALLIKLTSPRGPVFYTQERVGLDGKPFTVYKFRSMRYVGDQESPKWTTENDPRRTRLGRFIRRYSLDELPQFINVLVGDMSIVGPRPEQPHYVEQFSRTIPRYMRRHKEKAGITGWAQVNGLRGDTSITERTRYDLYYVENWSVLFDLKIMLKTVLVIFTDKNAY
jgi:Undecaprenyl-phosphate glucose phosphotransferase